MKKLEQKREHIRRECVRRGLRVNPYGKGYWVEGDGVSVIVCDLGMLSDRDLDPAFEVFER
jgi:hypothetical protein